GRAAIGARERRCMAGSPASASSLTFLPQAIQPTRLRATATAVHTDPHAALRGPRAYAPIDQGTPAWSRSAMEHRRESDMTIERPWLAHYPAGIPAEIDVDEFSSIPA